MIDLLMRRKIEVLRQDVSETLAEALHGSTANDVLFALADARDELSRVTEGSWDHVRARATIIAVEQLLRSWDRRVSCLGHAA